MLLQSSPSAVYQSSIDRVHAFVVGQDRQLYNNYWNGSQWVWEAHGTPAGTTVFASPVVYPCPVYQSSIDRVHAFVVGQDRQLYNNYWNGSQWVWEAHGTPAGTALDSDPSVVYQSSLDRVHAFVVGQDRQLYNNYWNGSRWVWEAHGTPPNTTVSGFPSAVYQPSHDRVHAFVAADGQLYDNYWNGSQWVWEAHGLLPSTTTRGIIPVPGVVYQSSIARIHVFVEGGDQQLYNNYWNGSGWVWEAHGAPPATTLGSVPSAVYQSSIDRIHAFVLGQDQQLYNNYWNGSQWVWEAHGTPM